ncbi:hypothetical protein JCM5350_006117 [Sporobolomyces pararoseus]
MSEYPQDTQLEPHRIQVKTQVDSRNRYSTATAEFEPTSEASSSGHSSEHSHYRSNSHIRTTSWQLPTRPGSSSDQPSPSLPYSCPSSPSPSSVSRASSIHSSSTSSRRPLPSPPKAVPRFVPFRSPPPPPPSLSTHDSAYEEKRELTRLRGLDDLLEREGESEGESSSSSPTFSELPAYEPSSSREAAGTGKRMLEEEETDQGEDDKARVELDEVRRRVNEESIRMIEEDSRNGKQRLLAQREQELEERRGAEEARRQVEMDKRVEAFEAERERVESPPPPPPLSPTSRDMLPLEDSKDNHLSRDPLIGSRSCPSPRNATFRQPTTFPPPSPVTTYSTQIPSPSFSSAHFTSSHQPTIPSDNLYPYRSQVNRPGMSVYGSNDSTTPIQHASSLPQVETHASPSYSNSKERQGSVGPASSFYSSAVGLTIEQLRLDDRQRQTRQLSKSTSSSSLSSRSRPVDQNFIGTGKYHQQGHIDNSAVSPPSHPSYSSLPPPRAQIGNSAHFTADSALMRQATTSPLHSRHPRFPSSLPSPSPSPSPSQSPFPPSFQGSEPAFYHAIGGQLLPFYPASTSMVDGPQTFISPAAARMPVSNLPLPPPPTPVSQFGHYSMSPSPYQPTSSSTIYQQSHTPTPFDQISQASPAPSDEPLRTRANRMSSIKNLFGRKGAREQSHRSQLGQEWSVPEE